MSNYEAPSITPLGSVQDLTLSGGSTIYKNAGSGDVIVISGESISIPGGGVTSVS